MKQKISFELTNKEIQLIIFIRNELPFGKGLLITHAGEPQGIETTKEKKIFSEILDKIF